LVIDTSNQTPQTVALKVFEVYRRWLTAEIWKQERSSITTGHSNE